MRASSSNSWSFNCRNSFIQESFLTEPSRPLNAHLLIICMEILIFLSEKRYYFLRIHQKKPLDFC